MLVLIPGASRLLNSIAETQIANNNRTATEVVPKLPLNEEEKLFQLRLNTARNDENEDGNRQENSPSPPVSATSQKTGNNHKKRDIPLQKQSAVQLWHFLETLLQQSKLQQIPIINALLAERLRESPNPFIYQAIHSLLTDPDYTLENKALLLDLLTEIATPEALTELLKLTYLGAESPLYVFILQAISRIGENRWDSRFHEELSSPLETVWSDPAVTDESLLGAIAKAIAEIGAPEGIAGLLNSISGNNTDAESNNADLIRASIAYALTGKVHNPNATQSLVECLQQADPKTPSSAFCLEALGQIGTPAATKAILNHAEKAQDDLTPQITHALLNIQSEQSLQLVTEASINKTFQSPQVQQAINTIASEISANSNSLSSSASK